MKKLLRKNISNKLLALSIGLACVLLAGCDGIKDLNFAQSAPEKEESKTLTGKDTSVLDEYEGSEPTEYAAASDLSYDARTVDPALDPDYFDPLIQVVEVDGKDTSDAADAKDLEEAIDASEMEIDNGCYAYTRLGREQQKLYLELYSILRNMLGKTIVSSKDPDEIKHVYRCIMIDHPELFYVDGYSIYKNLLGDEIVNIAFQGTYTMSEEEREDAKERVERYVTNVINNAPSGDDYTKIKYIYEYLVEHNDYNENAPENQNILSVVDYAETVCSGYAKMAQLIMNRMGIFSTLVYGNARSDKGSGYGRSPEWGAHVWNLVNCNGNYYNIDFTWGDSSFNILDESGESHSDGVNYEFLLVDDSSLLGTHVATPVVDLPGCNSMADNYYVREGRYIKEIDENKFKAIFDRAYADGEKNVYLKAEDNDVYRQMEDYLIKDENIFKFVVKDNIQYVPIPQNRIIIFKI